MYMNISKQLISRITILLTAICLPLTSFANDMMTITPISASFTQEALPGFGETDPSSPSFMTAQTAPQNAQAGASTGFSETDPVTTTAWHDWSAPQTSRNQVQAMPFGFEETDPTASPEESFCLDTGAKENNRQISLVFSSGNVFGC